MESIGRKEELSILEGLYASPHYEGMLGYDFYEAEFTEGKLDQKAVDSEKEQLKGLEVPYRKLGFVSKNGFDIKDEEDYSLIGLDDIHALAQEE